MSAYSCLPGQGSEPGAGWAWARAATRDHEVWLLTHSANAALIEPTRAADDVLRRRLRPVYLHLGGPVEWMRQGGPLRFVYYVLWQLGPCRRAARRLHSTIRFDVAHHMTYATDWAPAGIAAMPGLPFVWGPVGGSSTTGGPRLWRLLGVRAFGSELVRAVALSVLRKTVGRRNARQAAVVLGQNADVARAFAPVPVIVEPHVALEAQSHTARMQTSGTRVAVFAGRLLAWKGVRLALAALRPPEAAAWRLDIYGDGPERARLVRLAHRWGLADRVRFLGVRPRDEVRATLATADVLLFPSVHEAAGWAVAEALAAGCPVVALNQAGPAALLGPGDGVLVDPRGDIVGGLTAALDAAREHRPDSGRWSAGRLPDVLRRVYPAAVAGRRLEAAA